MQVRYQAALHADRTLLYAKQFGALGKSALFSETRLAGAAPASETLGAAGRGCAARQRAQRAARPGAGTLRRVVAPGCTGPRFCEGERLAIIADSIFSARSAFILYGLDARCLSY